ncbi:hypothetical protein IW261DRAFT_1572377 [Armillaria novae-zelandiae]|uniref:Heterokaryon incompatibility domain-containing protein n=1 Tax=Armillaria novae-zelandiae TaxID=153914 RepID=A0AA39NSR3_9AGAR|nr:hypothetical protein IW261DRAFT_1572377 [Armillaria novae-zelandiae]
MSPLQSTLSEVIDNDREPPQSTDHPRVERTLPETWSALLMSLLSSDWSDSDSESLDLTDFSRSAPVMEDVPPDIWKLVCETCWNTVFSVESFRIVWEALPENYYSKSAGFSYTTPTWRQIQCQQRRHLIKFCHQCEWCRIVCELIKKTQPRRQPPKDKILTNGKEESHFPIFIAEDDPAARFIPDRDILLDVDSSFAYGLIKKCVLECFHHEHCSLPQCARLPTRVIDCLDPNQPRLFISKGAKEHYVALSYVWGEGIPSENIPKMIIDAIIVTHKLGFRYLWVDSFCILQDSEDDKA